jgi:hypothetical protein
MDGELIVGLTNFNDAGHTYYVKLTILSIHLKMEKDCLKIFMLISRS